PKPAPAVCCCVSRAARPRPKRRRFGPGLHRRAAVPRYSARGRCSRLRSGCRVCLAARRLPRRLPHCCWTGIRCCTSFWGPGPPRRTAKTGPSPKMSGFGTRFYENLFKFGVKIITTLLQFRAESSTIEAYRVNGVCRLLVGRLPRILKSWEDFIMAVKVAINGFGRIGRLAFRQMFEAEGYEVVAIHDPTS